MDCVVSNNKFQKSFIKKAVICFDKAFEEGSTKEEVKNIFLEKFSFYFEGKDFYIPKSYARNIKNNARNRLIRKEFNGTNHQELAFKYGVSHQWIYKIVKGTNNG
ncbi:Mor transcription activator family protein [Pasteurella skyensis]|uniref:Mor transcription activator family protein n=1 Tax=Phocoenobacter skyensis TaxID=97481 RepID=A0A1H7Y3B9_9PAST|nr:Mor transcription activator family protein [Pasteurella skyensis]